MTDLSPARRARVVLSRISEPGDVRLTGLVAELGPETVLEELRARQVLGELHDGLAGRLAAADADADLAHAARRGIRFITPEDHEWPAALGDLTHPEPLHERGGVPVGLWARGPLRLDEAVAGAVAVVGSRSATSYGTGVAGSIAAEVGHAGRAVISGAAFGVDQAAHRGALAARGRTVAVLACGADRVYPRAHRDLITHIAEMGLVISEAAPGCAPTRVRFLARNRLIAALSAGTVVTEAAMRSGALNTANWAGALSRVLMGVPGPVTSAQSEGVHRLLRTRGGVLVTCGAEVLEAVAGSGEHLLEIPRGPVRPRDRLNGEQRLVLDAVPVVHAAPVVSIAHVAGVSDARVHAILRDLLALGLVERSADRWRLGPEGVSADAGS